MRRFLVISQCNGKAMIRRCGFKKKKRELNKSGLGDEQDLVEIRDVKRFYKKTCKRRVCHYPLAPHTARPITPFPPLPF